jgi:alpha/beta superfamily hydrolase
MLSIMDDCQESHKEQAGYLEICGEHLHVVLHKAKDPIATVLLAGPFASERNFSYIPWVQWARFLASRRIEALRFDYRGVGESTGVFEDMSFDDWQKDVEFLARWLQLRSPSLPLILHGMELGALLAGQTFAAGVGRATLLWAAPSTANDILRKALLRKVAVDHTFTDAATWRPISDYIRTLEQEQPFEVEGYQWPARLWNESFRLALPPSEPAGVSAGERPVRSVKLPKSTTPLAGPTGLRFTSVINPDLTDLFTENLSWLANAVESGGRS